MRYDQIKPLLDEEVLDEVKMSPSALQKFANSPEAEGMLMGIEFEMCVPNVAVDDDSGEGEYDYDMDERAYDIDGIIDFFRNGEMSNLGSSSADRLRNEMWDQYLDWQSGQIMENLDTDELNDRIRDRLDGEIDFDDMMELAREQWAENNPGENAESKEAEDEIHQMALALNEKTLDDMMEDTDGRDYQRAYDDIRQEMEDEMRDDGDYDQQAWLNDIGIDFMSEAEREWGLDWPHWTYYGGDGELDVETVGDEFGRAMGLEYVNTSNNYHGARRDGKNWIVEPDSSIDADEGDGGLEFVSPPMPIKDGLAMLEKIYAWAKKNGCYTNKSTGLHMNISVPDMTIENLDYVKLALFLGDEHVLKEFDRQYNSYAKSAMSIVKEKIQQNPENATALLAKMKEHLNAAASKLIHTGITNKYTSINTKSNYVEFRGPGGDYLNKNPIDLINTVLRLSMSLRIATDPNAYKQEYAKKLYKLVGPKEGDWTDPNNSVALFSRYALGEINKEELVSNVRQAQAARKEKKAGQELQYWVMNKDGSGGKQMVYARSETEAIILGGKQMGMTREDSISRLKAELVYRQEIEMPESTPRGWREWVNDILPTVNLETVNAVRQRIVNGQPFTGGDNLDADAGDWVVRQIDAELRRRMEAGETGEVAVELPTSWALFVNNINNYSDEVLANTKQELLTGHMDDQLNMAQVSDLLEKISAEQRRRSNNAELAANARHAENEVRASLPQGHREFLDDLANKSDMGLINILRNNNVYQGVSDQGAAYFRIQIKHELRRRGINPGSEEEANLVNNAAADQQQALVRDDPVTSNDPEAESPLGNTQVQSESINTIRRLAGLE